MKNGAKFFEMTEEQLDMVAGGVTTNTLSLNNTNTANTYNNALWATNVYQYGSPNTMSNNVTQKAQDTEPTTTQTWNTLLFGYNYPY